MSETFAIGCPLQPDHAPSMVRTDSGNLDVSVRFEEGEDVPNLIPRFLGDCCQFVPPANGVEKDALEVDLWTTSCPLNPGVDAAACFLRWEQPGQQT